MTSVGRILPKRLRGTVNDRGRECCVANRDEVQAGQAQRVDRICVLPRARRIT